MHDTDDLTRLLEAWQRTLDFIKAEAQRDPAFAKRLSEAVADVSLPPTPTMQRLPLPDLFDEFGQRGEVGFRVWLQTQTRGTLRALIRSYGLDPAKKTVGWRNTGHLADFIATRVSQRLQQGHVFLDQ